MDVVSSSDGEYFIVIGGQGGGGGGGGWTATVELFQVTSRRWHLSSMASQPQYVAISYM